MSGFERWIRLTVAGWTAVAAFGVAIVLFADEPVFGVVTAVVASTVGGWVWLRRSRLALAGSFILGIPVFLEHLGYVFADVSDGAWGSTFAQDLLGLAGGICVLVGSALSFRCQRIAAQAPTAVSIG